MGNQIFDREPPAGIVREFLDAEGQIAEIKGSQIVGNDNLVVHFYIDSLSSNVVPAGTTATFKAEFVFDEPPVDSLVIITFDWFDFSAPPYQYTEQRYDDPATMTDPTKQGGIISFSPDTTLDVYINAFAKSTSKGTLTLTRLA